ncbi:putative sinapine esterase [Helianthus annuus]|nr:putative sinapine esterase [Helianthus annuus]
MFFLSFNMVCINWSKVQEMLLAKSFYTRSAESLGLPLIPPYLSIKGSGSGSLMAFRQGVNYATGGSTAMSSSFIEAKCGESIVINGTLKDQLAWFKQSLPFICGNTNSSGMVVLCLLLLAIVFFGFQNIKT